MIVERQKLMRRLAAVTVDARQYELQEAKQGGKTLLVRDGAAQSYLHSKYNPRRSAEQFAKEVYTEAMAEAPTIVLYGLGLGYHVQALTELLADWQKLYVFEASLVVAKLAMADAELVQTLERDNIIFYCSDDFSAFVRAMDEALKAADDQLEIYMPSLKTVPTEMERLKDVLTEYKAAKNMLPYHETMMKENEKENAAAGYRDGIELLRGAYRGMPVIVVSAGASLDENIGQLKEVQNRALIVAVTRAAGRLAEEGIQPDYYVATDAAPWLRRHLNFDTMRAPLFLLSTADRAAADYPGEKLIVFEKTAAPERENTVETGGSVATCALSICTLLGAAPVIMMGQDLCFVGEKTHAGVSWARHIETKSGRKVRGTDGQQYPTTGSLHIYLKWIERFIARNKGTQFFNATARGAQIEGAPHILLVDFFAEAVDISNEKESIKRDKNLL